VTQFKHLNGCVIILPLTLKPNKLMQDISHSLSKGDQGDKLWIDVFEHTSLKNYTKIDGFFLIKAM
jgi:hypothetical protein